MKTILQLTLEILTIGLLLLAGCSQGVNMKIPTGTQLTISTIGKIGIGSVVRTNTTSNSTVTRA